MTTLTLYHLPYSHFSAKAKVVLIEKGIEFNARHIHELGDTPYTDINPSAKVPFLVTDDIRLGESEVIVEWLNDTYPEPAMLPPGNDDKARSRLATRIHDLYIAPDLSVLFGQLKAAERDVDLIDSAIDDIAKRLQDVEDLLSDGPFFSGEQFGIADASFAMSIWYSYWLFDQLGVSQKLAPLTKIQGWFAALEQRPSVQHVFDDCKIALGISEAV